MAVTAKRLLVLKRMVVSFQRRRENQSLRHFLKLTSTIEDDPMNFKGLFVNIVAKMRQKSSFFQNLS
jgi:hypothetical protein